jgi:hypothetical protein
MSHAEYNEIVSQVHPTPPKVDLDENEQRWLEARVLEYKDLLEYLRDH